jgi:CheY-like chemotaxis protein
MNANQKYSPVPAKSRLTLRDKILSIVKQKPKCSPEEVMRRCKSFTDDQVMHEIDQLHREALLRLQYVPNGAFALVPVKATEEQPVNRPQFKSAFPTILLIDGNMVDRDYYTQRLRVSLPESVVLHAVTGLSGLALCDRQPIDCVVLELDLPDISGFEVLLKLIPRAACPEIPVIILTRLSNPYLLQTAIKNGAAAALHKPLSSGDLLDQAIYKAMASVRRESKR